MTVRSSIEHPINIQYAKVRITQNSHGFVGGDVVRRSSGSYVKAKADVTTNCTGTVGVVESSDANTFVLVYEGEVTVSGASWTDGATYFLSAATAGLLTVTAPDINKPIMIATGATTGVVINQNYTGIAVSSIRATLTQASHGFAAKDVIKRGSGAYSKAQADTEANCKGTVGIVESVSGDDFVVVFAGAITSISSVTDGTLYYIDASTAGALTSTPPTVAKPILIATSTTTGIVINQNPGSSSGGKFDIKVEEVRPDDTNPTTNVTVSGQLASISFSGSVTNIVWLQIITNAMIDVAKDIKFEATYCMSSSESSKKVSMNADVWIFNDGDSPAKAANYSGQEDEITVPDDSTLDKLALTNIKVPLAALSGAGQLVLVKLWRDPAGTTPNHSGNFQMVGLRAYQS